jgi:hypothetical protein
MFYDIYLYTLCYNICCLLGACMRCTRLCSLKPGVTTSYQSSATGRMWYCGYMGIKARRLDLMHA